MKTKLTTYVLLTILFVSQSFASNLMSCEQNKHQTTPISVITDTHSEHAMHQQMNHLEADDNSFSESDMSMDCCADDCACPVGACASAALLGSLFQLPLLIPAEKVQYYSIPHPTPYNTPLNKPPIFA